MDFRGSDVTASDWVEGCRLALGSGQLVVFP